MMENVNEIEQNSEMDGATAADVDAGAMHDVPLTSNEETSEQADENVQQPPVGKTLSKNGSLKRFFKLSNKKSGGSSGGKNAETDEASSAGIDADNEEDEQDRQTAEMVKLTNEKNKEESADKELNQLDSSATASTISKPQYLGRVRSRRFNFRFGNNAEADAAAAAAAAVENAANSAPTSSHQVTAASRHSLRSSLSTYFNSVFKRKQNANSKHTLRTAKKKQQETENQGDDNVSGNGNENENGIEMVEQTALKTPTPSQPALKAVEPDTASTQQSIVGHEQQQELPQQNVSEDFAAAPTAPKAF